MKNRWDYCSPYEYVKDNLLFSNKTISTHDQRGPDWAHKNNRGIDHVIYNPPATIVFWKDGTKTVVKCYENDEYDPEKGLAMAICKKTYGNEYRFHKVFKKHLPKEEVGCSENPPIKLKAATFWDILENLSKKTVYLDGAIKRKGYDPIEKAYKILVDMRDGESSLDELYGDLDEAIGYLGEALE